MINFPMSTIDLAQEKLYTYMGYKKKHAKLLNQVIKWLSSGKTKIKY